MSSAFNSVLKNGFFTLLAALTIFSFVRDTSQISDRLSNCGRVGGVFVGVDCNRLRVISRPKLVDEVNFADQLRSEFNPLSEPARYGVAPGLQRVVVV
jgi:hypothetical protein